MRVWREGIPTNEEPSRWIRPNGVDLPDRPVSVMVRTSDHRPVTYCLLSRFRRERGGWVTAVPTRKLPPEAALAVAISGPRGTKLDDNDIHGRVLNFSLTTAPMWPGMFS